MPNANSPLVKPYIFVININKLFSEKSVEMLKNTQSKDVKES